MGKRGKYGEGAHGGRWGEYGWICGMQLVCSHPFGCFALYPLHCDHKDGMWCSYYDCFGSWSQFDFAITLGMRTRQNYKINSEQLQVSGLSMCLVKWPPIMLFPCGLLTNQLYVYMRLVIHFRISQTSERSLTQTVSSRERRLQNLPLASRIDAALSPLWHQLRTKTDPLCKRLSR